MISCHSRDIGYLEVIYVYITVPELLKVIWKCETGWGVMMMYKYGSRTGFLGALVLSESVKDRSLSAVLIGD